MRLAGPWYDFCVNQHDNVCNQKYDNDHKYSFHLNLVYKVSLEFEHLLSSEEDRHTTKMAAMGHDLIEDARVTYNDIKLMAGERVADIIYACTEEKGRNRAERHSPAYYQGLADNRLALFVKLCDVVANVKYSLLTNSGMLEKYRKELPNLIVLKSDIDDEFNPLFNHLKSLVIIKTI